MREYYTIEHFLEVPKSRRVKDAYSTWDKGLDEYETLEEAIAATKDSSGKKRIVKHTEEVVYIDE